MMKQQILAVIDLTRAHFFFVWPLLFCSGLLLAFHTYGGFSFDLLLRAIFIGLFGFLAGLVLNDYVDRDIDRKDVDASLTRYWRPFHERPIVEGRIAPGTAFGIFLLLAAAAAILILTLPYPNSLCVLVIMAYAYAAEYFYQVKKRNQRIPIAQVVGRTDFALFPVAGYLAFGSPDVIALLYFLFFYPWTLAHLGVNDMADIVNDRVRGLATIPVLYGMEGASRWVLLFTAAHGVLAIVFAWAVSPVLLLGFVPGFALIALANYLVVKRPDAGSALRALPLLHASLLFYAVAIIVVALL
jgi:4-hydroxybenzoate polyprenyltransferase